MEVKTCPYCDSNNLILDNGGITGKHKCNDCKYIGNLVLFVEIYR